MDGGWIKVWRKVQNNAIFTDDALFKCWVYCLMQATHKEIEFTLAGKIINLLPGQFISGREKANKDLKWSGKKFDRKMQFLEKHGYLTREVTSHFTKNTIINWDIYQINVSEGDQLSDQQVTSTRPAGDQQVTTNKNNKNIKNKEEDVLVSKKKKPKTSYPADEDFILSLKNLYPYIDINQELNKMKAWLMTPKGRGRQLNRRFIVNWLNKIDKPISTAEVAPINEQDKKSWEIKRALDKIKWKEKDEHSNPT